ncbi:MAG: YihY/virulence factor BrkB family protein [Halobaculum sp.]
MSRFSRLWTVTRAVVHEVRTEQVTFLAGSVAYHAFVSLLPLLLLLVVVLSALGPLAPTDAVFAVVSAALTQGAADALLGELQRVSRSRSLSVAGVAVLVWGTLRVFRGIDTAFSDIYETEGANSFLDQLTDGVVVFVAFAAAIVVAGLLRGVVPDGSGPLVTLVGRVALVVGLFLTLLPMYYVFPDAEVTIREVVPGTLFTAVGLTAFESLFSLYVAWSGNQPGASVVAAVLVFLTWLYFSGLLLLVGAAINAVLANRSADVEIRPVIGDGPARATDDAAAVERLVGDADGVTIRAGGTERTLSTPRFVHTDDGFALRWAADDVSTGDGPPDDGVSDGDASGADAPEGGVSGADASETVSAADASDLNAPETDGSNVDRSKTDGSEVGGPETAGSDDETVPTGGTREGDD